MNTLFITISVIAFIIAIVFYIVYRKRINAAFQTASAVAVICSILFAGCYFLDIASLFQKEHSTVYIPVTTYQSTSYRQSGRPVQKSTTTTASKETDNYDGKVYITRSGTKYHYSYTCGGNEYYECTLSQALDRGLTPCKRCTQ